MGVSGAHTGLHGLGRELGLESCLPFLFLFLLSLFHDEQHVVNKAQGRRPGLGVGTGVQEGEGEGEPYPLQPTAAVSSFSSSSIETDQGRLCLLPLAA